MRPIYCVLCVLSLVAGTSAATTTSSARPNVIVITLDTTRADRMGFLGSKKGLTPNLDALARQSVVFTRAYCQVPLTTASHATILTGTYPQYHQVNDFGVPLAKDLPFAPDLFRAHGYQTAAFIGSLVLDPTARSAPGFDRGFDYFDSDFHRRRPGEDRYHAIERRGDEVVARALTWLRAHPRGPFFLWVHLYDAHDPYDPPEPYKTRFASAPYNGEIAYEDSAVGKLLSQLKLRGLYDSTLLAVMADHGEALGEHNEETHGIFLYDETIHVPLMFKLPREHLAGKRIENRVELVDVLPTLLQVAAIPIPGEVQGQSLLATFRGPTHTGKKSLPAGIQDRPSYSESDYPHRTFGWSTLRAWRAGKYLFVEAPNKELYDQSTDPSATHNLSSAAKAITDTLGEQLESFRQRTSTSKQAPTVATDPALQERLSALGYVASDSAAAPMPGIKETGADPKDKVEVVNLMHRAEILKEELHFAEAVPLLRQVIAKEPHLPIAYLQLGTALSSLRNYEEAIPVLRKAVELRPDLTVPHYQLGSALFETNDFADAATEFEAALVRLPEWAEARFSLATTYARLDRLPDAIREYQKVIADRPRHYGAHLLLGRALALSGDPAAAVPVLIKATQLQPASGEPHRFLADAYSQLGREDNAEKERREAVRLQGNVKR